MREASGVERAVRLQDIARINHRTLAEELWGMNADTSPSQFSPSGELLWTQQPAVGRAPSQVLCVLQQHLRAHTTTAHRCTFAVWEGWGGMHDSVHAAPALELPFRRYLLWEGLLDDVEQVAPSVTSQRFVPEVD
jgi:hypothetical protein